MFELGSSIKIKCSNLVWAWDKPKNNVWTRACENAKKFELGLAWLFSQAKIELHIKLKLELKSGFLAWDPKKNCIIKCLYHQKSSKQNTIIYSFYHASNSTRDYKLFKLQLYIIKSIHSSFIAYSLSNCSKYNFYIHICHPCNYNLHKSK